MVSPRDYADRIAAGASIDRLYPPVAGPLKPSGGRLRGRHTCGGSANSVALSIERPSPEIPLGRWKCHRCGASGDALNYPNGDRLRGPELVAAVDELARRLVKPTYSEHSDRTPSTPPPRPVPLRKRAEPVPEPVSKAPKPAADPAELGEWWGDTPGVWDTPGEIYLRGRKLWPDDDESVWERWEVRVSKVARWADRDAIDTLRSIPGVNIPRLPTQFAGAVAYIEHGPDPAPGSGEWWPPIVGFHLDGIKPDGTHPPLPEDRWRRNAGERGSTTVALTTDAKRPCIVTEGVTDLLAVLALRSIGEVLTATQEPLPALCAALPDAGEVRSLNGVDRFKAANLDPHLPAVIAPHRDERGLDAYTRLVAEAAELPKTDPRRAVTAWKWWRDAPDNSTDLADALTRSHT